MLCHLTRAYMKKSALAEPHAGFQILRYFWVLSSFRFNEALELIKQTVSAWIDDKAPRLGASLAFYTLLSLAPLLIVIVAVAALVYGREAARGQLVWQIQGFVGPEGAMAIQGLIEGAYKPGDGIVASLLGLLTLAFGASSVVVELRDALNTIWHVAPDPRNTGLASIFRLAKERFYSFALILGVGFLLLVSLLLNAWIAAMGSFFSSFLPTPEAVLHTAAFFLSFFVITFLFAAVYKLLPDVQLRWSDVVIGACVTSLLFTIGKQLIGLYLGKATFASTYGAAGSLVIVLVWVYYSAMLFFLGAEFTKVYTKTFGSHLPNKLQPVPSTPDKVVVNHSTELLATDDNSK
jgi:membrane protein